MMPIQISSIDRADTNTIIRLRRKTKIHTMVNLRTLIPRLLPLRAILSQSRMPTLQKISIPKRSLTNRSTSTSTLTHLTSLNRLMRIGRNRTMTPETSRSITLISLRTNNQHIFRYSNFLIRRFHLPFHLSPRTYIPNSRTLHPRSPIHLFNRIVPTTRPSHLMTHATHHQISITHRSNRRVQTSTVHMSRHHVQINNPSRHTLTTQVLPTHSLPNAKIVTPTSRPFRLNKHTVLTNSRLMNSVHQP